MCQASSRDFQSDGASFSTTAGGYHNGGAMIRLASSADGGTGMIASSRGIIPRAKIKTIKMTVIIVAGELKKKAEKNRRGEALHHLPYTTNIAWPTNRQKKSRKLNFFLMSKNWYPEIFFDFVLNKVPSIKNMPSRHADMLKFCLLVDNCIYLKMTTNKKHPAYKTFSRRKI